MVFFWFFFFLVPCPAKPYPGRASNSASGTLDHRAPREQSISQARETQPVLWTPGTAGPIVLVGIGLQVKLQRACLPPPRYQNYRIAGPAAGVRVQPSVWLWLGAYSTVFHEWPACGNLAIRPGSVRTQNSGLPRRRRHRITADRPCAPSTRLVRVFPLQFGRVESRYMLAKLPRMCLSIPTNPFPPPVFSVVGLTTCFCARPPLRFSSRRRERTFSETKDGVQQHREARKPRRAIDDLRSAGAGRARASSTHTSRSEARLGLAGRCESKRARI